MASTCNSQLKINSFESMGYEEMNTDLCNVINSA